MRKIFLFLALAVALVVKAQDGSVSNKIDSLLNASELLKTSQMGMVVWDLTADSLLYERNGRQTLRPASTMKLLTAITALDRLGTDYVLSTKLCYTGTIENGVLRGNLICSGGMDPLFDHTDMQAFVESVRTLGIDSITGFVGADRSFKDDKLLGEGWCWDDDNPVLSPLVYNRKDVFVETFARQLMAAGVKGVMAQASGTVDMRGRETPYIICVRTHNIDQVLLRMMKDSDNLFAECLFYQLASSGGHRPATAKQSAALVKEEIERVGLNPANYRVADGSGLSLYNYVSAELLVRLLRHAYKNEAVFRHLLPSLPIAGWDGTLKNRMDQTAAFGNVKAKTGTLTGIISLAGYCTTANDHQLCFAIINQGVLSASQARRLQDRICIELCR